MKICPTCRKTYTDDGLNFCLDDGSVLTLAASDAPPTVMMQQPPATTPNAPTIPQVSQHGVQTSWQKNPDYSVQPKKSSKTWMWVVGIVGLLLLFCGGGFISLIAIAIYNADSNNSNYSSSDSNSSRPPSPSPTPNDGRTKLQAISLAGWVQANSLYGNTEYKDGELIISPKKSNSYYVLVAQRDYTTENANTRVTVRNIDNDNSDMGYGLVFHSNPMPLQQDYAFLIDTKKGRYRVVRHVPQDEPVVTSWTNSTAVKSGSDPNVLEVKDKDGSLELYINDQKVTTMRNLYGYKPGVPGIYSGDGVRAAFSKLEIRK